MEPNASANAMRRKATKREQISLKDKLDIIEQVEKGKKQVDVAVAYGLSKQTVSTINAKEAILAKEVSDDDLVSSEQLTDEEIVAQIRQAPNAEQEQEQTEEGNSGIVTEKVTTSQALDYIQGLKNYFEQQATTSDEMNTLVMMETRVVSKAVRHTVQAKLTSFFQNI
ncbi:hypothetical protein HPB52_022068 [Rhipicephalus sanguineus]|uniref:HTH psq-type domain-containing protein n=1 Tax=Rhipicephalus sanguineus TaxID=34632 RepID=A0A9D4PGM2_RHISA|nr:hypothetical protein HPB52_022068 [Rhipicephalus sanguineus]